MSDKIESDWSSFNGISKGTGTNSLPIQTLPDFKKKEQWRKACMDRLESIGIRQLHKNIRFRAYRQMMEGEFTYSAVGIEEADLPWFNKEVRSLRTSQGISTYLKHFDFIGIIVNTLVGIYTDFEDKFSIDSRDEYSTNEFIRQKTELLHKYAAQVFQQEINKLLLMKGFDPNKQDFQSEEEAQAYQQELQQQAQALTPPEIERFMSKNFKVLAVEWAQNTIQEDNTEFKIPLMDKENFIDYLLTGRYFKHFGVGYDNYYVERWKVEETFFSEDADAQYPQEGEFVGRVTNMSTSNILNKFGHLMSEKQQRGIGNYWNKSEKENYDYSVSNAGSLKPEDAFGTPTVIPFHNYFDHQANLQLEEAFGAPMGRTTVQDKDGEEHTFSSWIPREENDNFRSDLYSAYLRDDIDVRQDTVRVTEAYWRSYKRLGVLIHENETGAITVDLVTDDLLSEYLTENEIKKLRNTSLQQLQAALKNDNLAEFVNTITYTYVPEIWKGIKIRGNGNTLREDLYLDVKPLEYQIKGSRSNIYNVLLPVSGIITSGLIKKIFPYQQLHNICMNQNTELLEKELGVFFTLDINALPSELREEGIEESLISAREQIKDTSLLLLDASRQNTQANIPLPNLFNRQEITFTNQIQSRWAWAQQYKAEGLSQIGITPQMLGAPNTYTTAEGVKQGLQASYAIINPLFEKFNEAKGKELELHIAVAQFCQVNGKDQTVMFRKGDGELRFLDILKQDGELFPLRHLGVMPVTSSKERKIITELRQLILNDNTLTKSFKDSLDILTNSTIVELKEIAQNMERKTQQETQAQREFEQSQLDKTIEAQNAQKEGQWNHELAVEDLKGKYRLKEEEIQSLGRLNDNESTDVALMDRISKITQDQTANNFRAQEIGIKEQEVQRKANTDSSQTNIALKKLQQKDKELELKEKQIEATKFTSTINKN